MSKAIREKQAETSLRKGERDGEGERDENVNRGTKPEGQTGDYLRK